MMVEAKVKGTCTSKNGEFDIGSVTVELRDGKAVIGFVSRRLHRKLHAGATIDAESMDRLALEWVKMRFPGRPGDRLAVKVALDEASAALGRAREELGMG